MSGSVITVRNLTKSYGAAVAVDDLSFDVEEGKVTAFLGPNGAGKTTTIRVLLGLAPADEGEALVLGEPYRALDRPASRVGALIDGAGFHPARTARNHLRVLTALNGIADRRVEEVLDAVDLTAAADRKVGGFSLGMRRRLGLATALLAEPEILILDEPANGLDPAGIRWLRESLRAFAAGGGTVLVSSHVLAEVAQTADVVVVVNNGKLVTERAVRDLTAGDTVTVKSPDRERLRRALATTGAGIRVDDRDGLTITGITAQAVGEVAARERVVLSELVSRGQTLEDVFIELTTEGAHHVAS